MAQLTVTVSASGKAAPALSDEIASAATGAAEAQSLKAPLKQLYDTLDRLDAEIARGETDALIETAGRKFPVKPQPDGVPHGK